MVDERRKIDRRTFSYYIPVTDAVSEERVGIMMDISLGGFRIDSKEPIPGGKINRLRLNLSEDIASQPFLKFAGRSIWCHPDYIDPSIYNVGFEIISLSPSDTLIYKRLFEKYGSQSDGIGKNNYDFLWK
jgi:hypothetical protein